MHTIAVVNFKGGVTKTSTVVGLGEALADGGKRVLLVDCDAQSHVAAHLGIESEALTVSLADVLETGRDIDEIVVETPIPNLYVAPSVRALAEARTFLTNRRNRDGVLARALRTTKAQFDCVLIDTPPDEGILTINAMFAADHVIVPTPLDSFSLSGISGLVESLASLQDAYEYRSWTLLGIVITRFDRRTSIENIVALKELEAAFDQDQLLFETRLRADEHVRQAQRFGTTVGRYAPDCRAAQDFRALARELLERLEAPRSEAA